MKFLDVLYTALSYIKRMRIKTFLTALSVSVGVAAVVFITSIGNAGEIKISDMLDGLGFNGFTAFISGGASNSGKFAASDAEEIEKKVKGVSTAMPVIIKYGQYRSNQQNGNVIIWGIGREMGDAINVKSVYGRLPNGTDIRYGKDVAVIDISLANKLYKRDNIVGCELFLTCDDSIKKYEIIGIIEQQAGALNNLFGGKIPYFIYVPYTSIPGYKDGVDQIAVSCLANSSDTDIKNGIKSFLDRKYKNNGEVFVENISEYKDVAGAVIRIVSLIISAVAGISLCTACMGVANTMLFSASERKNEIGIYMALGARKKDIVRCFFVQSILICMFGGAFGAVLGTAASLSLFAVIGESAKIDILFLAAAEGVSIICGVVCGVYPAIHASKIDPIDALREG